MDADVILDLSYDLNDDLLSTSRFLASCTTSVQDITGNANVECLYIGSANNGQSTGIVLDGNDADIQTVVDYVSSGGTLTIVMASGQTYTLNARMLSIKSSVCLHFMKLVKIEYETISEHIEV